MYRVMHTNRTARRVAAVIITTLATGAGTVGHLKASGPTPAESIARLKAGNTRFVENPADALPVDAARRTALAKAQTPFATVLTCADSRVPPEVVFHTGLGDLFVVRAAGHVTDRSVLGSVEYGAEHLHTPVIVVMGHESCGAVKAAVETPPGTSLGPNLDYMLKAIRPAVARAASDAESMGLRGAILANVEETINDMLEQSAILKHLAESGQVVLVGAYYELGTGRAHFSEPVRLPRNATSHAAHR
jgi:carbonic anhydrase